MKLLYLSSWFPFPADNGSRQRAFYLLKELSARHTLSLVAFYDADQTPPQTDALRAYARDITALPRPVFAPRRARALGAFFSPLPRSVVDTYDAALHAQLRAKTAREKFDAILVGELGMAAYARGLEAPLKILDDVEASVFVEPFRAARGLERVRRGLTWWKYKRYVQTLAPQFDALTVVSTRERTLVEALGIAARKIHVIPNGVDCAQADAPSVKEPYSCIYSGAVTYAANLDAVRYFVREILPLVRAQTPEVRVRVTGRADQVAINELSEDNVVLFTGYVPDVKALVRASAVCIVPLRRGGGTRLKILEALALRTPVVSTTKGAEGLDLAHGEHLLLADTPREFADAVNLLLHDPARREKLANAAYARVCATYAWQKIAQQLDRVLVERAPH